MESVNDNDNIDKAIFEREAKPGELGNHRERDP